ncbi:glycerophosphodiester phosphodiesterase [Haloimpatiens sp. FM7330]|uniref:glycerophosphodiester phosphodiesterase n=1 Tax=Haloimpatiens sp. FM7330 TaxID=3298610 RepID=UPI00363CFB2F
MKNIFNIAHRGASAYYPENTMLAFEKALHLGSTGIELDVQLTKDNIPVIIHDEKVDRTTNGTGYVKDYTYSKLYKLDAGVKKSEKFKGEKIPSLDYFLEYVKNKNILINIELKNTLISHENIVIDKIHKYNVQNNVIISSFNHSSLKNCKTIDTNIKTAILYSCLIYNIQQYAETLNVNALHLPFYCVDNNTVKSAHSKKFMINTYTVNNKNRMIDMIRFNVDGIITDYPDILSKLLKKIN